MPARGVARDLFISNNLDSTPVVLVLKKKNKTYKQVRQITTGLTRPGGLWVDKQGDLYVTNFGTRAYAGYVAEYQPGGSSPSCTYDTGLMHPVYVTTDNAGNVYVADFGNYGGSTNGDVVEYAQCQNTILKQYQVSGPQTEGVAVDQNGDIFVSYGTSAPNVGHYEEFKGGSGTPTVLGATTEFPGGLIIDRKGNLITGVQGYNYGAIDVIAPPYKTAKMLVPGNWVHGLSLNRSENLLFSANGLFAQGSQYRNVTIFKYPSGKLVQTLGASDGVTQPIGVAVAPDATF
jgi:hypothetical protein